MFESADTHTETWSALQFCIRITAHKILLFISFLGRGVFLALLRCDIDVKAHAAQQYINLCNRQTIHVIIASLLSTSSPFSFLGCHIRRTCISITALHHVTVGELKVFCKTKRCLVLPHVEETLVILLENTDSAVASNDTVQTAVFRLAVSKLLIYHALNLEV